MKEISFDVHLTAKELFLFSMRHTYVSMSGIFGLFISIGSIGIFFVKYASLDTAAKICLLVIGCLFTIVQPLMLYSKARAQSKQNKDISDTLHYQLGEKGITVSQGEQEVFIHWYEVQKKVQTKSAVYLYMSPVRAFIFPKMQLGEQYASMCQQVEQQMDAYKEYEPEQEEGHDGK